MYFLYISLPGESGILFPKRQKNLEMNILISRFIINIELIVLGSVKFVMHSGVHQNQIGTPLTELLSFS